MSSYNRLLLLLPWCIVLLIAGCGQSPAEMATKGAATEYYFYDGPTSIEERIVLADVIARVRLISVDGAVVAEPGDFYYGALEFRFRVLEYIKGGGGSEVVAVALAIYEGSGTEAEVRATLSGLVAARDTRWDDSEAIVFLEDYYDQDGRTTYRLGLNTMFDEDAYTVASRRDKRWLPEAPTTTSSMSRSTDTAEKRFLLDAPSNVGAQGSLSRSVSPPAQAATAPTMTLSAFKAKVAELQAEVAAGDGSEEYRDCVYSKYYWPRRLRWRAENVGRKVLRHDYDLGSGLPSGSLIYEASVVGLPPDRVGRYWLEGENADLFTVETVGTPVPYTRVPYPSATPENRIRSYVHISTIRPLPASEYKFYSNAIWGGALICGRGQTEYERNLYGRNVHVTTPHGTVHEAFFDPVAIGAAVGADGANGVLKPAAFTVGGASATITSLKWESGTVTMELDPSASLAGHAIDFIALDGSVSTTLSFDEATQGGGGSLTWRVPNRPWSAGDLLMLRVHSVQSRRPQ